MFFSSDVICEKAKRLVFMHELDPMEAPSFLIGWLLAFKNWHGLKAIHTHVEGGSVDTVAIEAALLDLLRAIAEYQPCNIFDMDETKLFYRMALECTIEQLLIKGSKKDKTHITVALTVNATSKEKLLLFFIGHATKP